MGEVAVLHAQDVLNRNHHRTTKMIPPAMKSQPGRNPNLGSGNTRSSNRRKRSPQKYVTPVKELKASSTASTSTSKPSTDHLGMGQVRILKRGDALPSFPIDASKEEEEDKVGKEEDKKIVVEKFKVSSTDDLFMLSSTDRLGPDPEVVPKQIRRFSDFFAGSVCLTSSPPPSSLPVPAFFKKKDGKIDDSESSSPTPTNNLVRLLRLNLA